MSLADDYARRYARWAREHRENLSSVYRCAHCGDWHGELIEYGGRFWCVGHVPAPASPQPLLLPAAGESLR